MERYSVFSLMTKMTLEVNQKGSKMMIIGENSPKSKVKVRSLRYVNEFTVVATKNYGQIRRRKGYRWKTK